MAFEIERKFSVRNGDWRPLATSATRLRQVYLSTDGRASVRVRIIGEQTAKLTITSRGADLRRLELEYDIPMLEAEALFALRDGTVVEKVRHIVPWQGFEWEIDVFAGENAGLVLAEVELSHEHQHVPLPPWIGAELTGQPQFYNHALARRPYRTWPSADDAQGKRA
jgi:adenylate cyclase